MLNNHENPDDRRSQRRFTVCASDGTFTFTTYTLGDGVPEGNYVATLAQLIARQDHTFMGPDQFENLYSDPDKSDLKIEHKAPGKTNYLFEVQVSGRDPVNDPGPRAVTRFIVLQSGKPR